MYIHNMSNEISILFKMYDYNVASET
jgi:hypothetical protein